jgi:hypothetical protein
MSIDGKWNITVQSPMGAQKSEFSFNSAGSTLNGSQSSPQGSVPISNGTVEGDAVSWASAITSPMPMTLTFSGKVNGDALAGSVKAGNFGSFNFSGSRA